MTERSFVWQMAYVDVSLPSDQIFQFSREELKSRVRWGLGRRRIAIGNKFHVKWWKQKVCWAGWVSAPGDSRVGTCGCAHSGGWEASKPFPLGFCWCTWQWIPSVQNGNNLDSRGILLINPLFTSGWNHSKMHSTVWVCHVFIKDRRCLLWLRTWFWLSTKIPYIGIHATIFYVKAEKFFILLYFSSSFLRCGSLILFIYRF